MGDLGIVIAIVGTGIAIVGAIISMMFWARSEANHTREMAREDRRDGLNLIRSIELQIKEFHTYMKKQK